MSIYINEKSKEKNKFIDNPYKRLENVILITPNELKNAELRERKQRLARILEKKKLEWEKEREQIKQNVKQKIREEKFKYNQYRKERGFFFT